MKMPEKFRRRRSDPTRVRPKRWRFDDGFENRPICLLVSEKVGWEFDGIGQETGVEACGFRVVNQIR